MNSVKKPLSISQGSVNQREKSVDALTAPETSIAGQYQHISQVDSARILAHPEHDELHSGTMPDEMDRTRFVNDNTFTKFPTTPRGTSPPPDINPIGFERGLAHRLGHQNTHLRMSARNVLNCPFSITTSGFRASHTKQQEDEDTGPSCRLDNIGDSDLTSRESSGVRIQESKNGNIFGNFPFINLQTVMCKGTQHVSTHDDHQNEELANHETKDKSDTNDTPGASIEESGIYNARWDKAISRANDPADVNGDRSTQNQAPHEILAYQTSDQESTKSTSPMDSLQHSDNSTKSRSDAPTHSSNASKDVQKSNDSTTALIQPGMHPSNQLLKGRGHLTPMHTDTSLISRHVGNDGYVHCKSPSEEMGLPRWVNCAVWITGIPKEIPQDQLYRELFKVVSVGPIVSAYIHEARYSHSGRVAKVVFKHTVHAERLCYNALKYGITINGEDLRIKPNKLGYHEYPTMLHHQSRVVIVVVVNDTSKGLEYWLNFVKGRCTFSLESTRHLAYSTPNRMVMEFRFAQIYGQAEVFLKSIRKTPEFKGNVSARYTPDVNCDICYKPRDGLW